MGCHIIFSFIIELNPWPSCCKAIVLTIVPLCCLINNIRNQKENIRKQRIFTILKNILKWNLIFIYKNRISLICARFVFICGERGASQAWHLFLCCAAGDGKSQVWTDNAPAAAEHSDSGNLCLTVCQKPGGSSKLKSAVSIHRCTTWALDREPRRKSVS